MMAKAIAIKASDMPIANASGIKTKMQTKNVTKQHPQLLYLAILMGKYHTMYHNIQKKGTRMRIAGIRIKNTIVISRLQQKENGSSGQIL